MLFLVAFLEQMYDAICIGSGLIGGAASSVLRISKFLPKQKVLLVDSARRPSFLQKEIKDLRQIAVNSSSRNLLSDIGAWDRVSNRAWPVHQMSIAEGVGKSGLLFESKNSQPLNYITEAGLISEAIVNAAEQNGVELMFESKVSNLIIPERFNPEIHDTDFVTLEVNDQLFETKLILGCDGANSMVRKAMGIKSKSKMYNQRGVVATVEILESSTHDGNHTAFQRFLPDGSILAFLPCDSNQISIVWSCSDAKAEKLQQMSKDDLVNIINQAMREDYSSTFYNNVHNFLAPLANRFGVKEFTFNPPEIKSILSPVASFPLATANSKCTGPRSVLLGDAAHRVHPMAGQGANMGYRDAEILLDVMEKFHTRGTDPTSELCLRDFENEIYKEHTPMMVGIDALKTIYSQNNPIFSTIRNIGTATINSNPAAKELFISRAA